MPPPKCTQPSRQIFHSLLLTLLALLAHISPILCQLTMQERTTDTRQDSLKSQIDYLPLRNYVINYPPPP